MWARTGAWQEVWCGCRGGSFPNTGRSPGAMGARPKLSPIVWAFVVRMRNEVKEWERGDLNP